MAKGNTENLSDDTSVTRNSNGPETQEISETEMEESELTVEEETEAVNRSANEGASMTTEQETEQDLSSFEQDEEDTIQSDAYEKLYSEILEHFRSFSPAEQIAGKITKEHITEYLEMNREERIQQYRERREKRLITALELFAILGTILATVNFLRNDPAILVNILYIIGALGAFFLWKHPRDKEDKK